MLNINAVNRKLTKLAVTVLLGSCAAVQAATDLGDFTGSPQDTWDGLREIGIEVRNFNQTNLLNQQETVLRRYLQYVPSSIHRHRREGKTYPLVIMLPGAGLSAELGREWDWGDRVEKLANKEKFMVVYANSAAEPDTDTNPENLLFANAGYWRTCFGKPGASAEFWTVDDIAYLRSIIARVQDEGLPVDKNRIYLMGMSNGGEMVQRAAREMPELLAGGGVVMPVNSMPATVPYFTCEQIPQRPISMMFIYSPKDTLLDTMFSSMGFDYGAVIKDSLVQWRNALKIDSASEKVRLLPNRVNEGAGYTGNVPWALDSLNSTVRRYDYRKAAAGNVFRYWKSTPSGGMPGQIPAQPISRWQKLPIMASKIRISTPRWCSGNS